MTQADLFAGWVRESRRMVFFGGAGVSTESGIPDFRSTDGLYSQRYRYPPETMLSHSFFVRHPAEFFEFYRDKMLMLGAKPNAAHRKLAELERAGTLTAIITQNIDGLHQAAGSRHVLEVHGSVHRNYCEGCGKFYDVQQILTGTGIPTCGCGGIIKPDVVLYEEEPNPDTMAEAVRQIQNADLLVVGGTSLSVYPAAGLLHYYRGDRLVLINRTETAFDDKADLVIHESLGSVFSTVRM